MAVKPGKEYPTGQCERCDEPFPITRKDRRFCSDYCSRHATRPVRYKRVCPMCEKRFATNAPRREFCSIECRADARRTQFKAVVDTVHEMQTWKADGLEVGRIYTILKHTFDLFMVNGLTGEALVWMRHRLDKGDLAVLPPDLQIFGDQLLDAIATTLEARTGYRPITRLSVEHVIEGADGA